jgi:hypothetical protein
MNYCHQLCRSRLTKKGTEKIRGKEGKGYDLYVGRTEFTMNQHISISLQEIITRIARILICHENLRPE